MSHQIHLFLGPELDQRLIEYIFLSHRAVFLPYRSFSPNPTLIKSSIYSPTDETTRIIVSRNAEAPRYKINPTGDGRYIYDILSNSAIVFDRCFVGPNFIRRGGLSYADGGPDADLSGWARALYRDIRKNLNRGDDRFYIGREALELKDRGYDLLD